MAISDDTAALVAAQLVAVHMAGKPCEGSPELEIRYKQHIMALFRDYMSNLKADQGFQFG